MARGRGLGDWATAPSVAARRRGRGRARSPMTGARCARGRRVSRPRAPSAGSRARRSRRPSASPRSRSGRRVQATLRVRVSRVACVPIDARSLDVKARSHSSRASRISSRASSCVGAHVITLGSSSMVARTHPFSSGSKTTCRSTYVAYSRPCRPILRRVTALRVLERHLAENGCERVRHGARHDVWRSEAAERPVTVPRHRELPYGTARAICRQLGIPNPPR
jgi:mRNA interferase HicA